MKRGVCLVMCAALFAGFGASASENDFESRFELRGKEYKQVILEKELLKGPEWNIESGKECPLAVSKAIASARIALEKSFPDTKKWVVYTVSLCSQENKLHWYYDVGFESPDGDDAVNLAVLFNGSVPPIKKM